MDSSRHISFLQANLNHSAGAQDLLLQSLAQWEVDVAVVSEPYFVPPQTHWVGDLDGSVAVVVRAGVGPTLSAVERGSGYVVAGWGEYTVVGVYFSPNRPLAEFETFLDCVRAAVARRSPGSIVVLGDFNAKSQAWGNPATDGRGEAVQVWGLLSGLSLLNRGAVHTCVRHNGGSVVDLSFATPAVARRVSRWRVEEGVETLSDHLYIRFEVSPLQGGAARPPRGPSAFPRWALSRLDKELAEEAAIVQRWFASRTEGASVDELAERMRTALTRVCDAAMPRARRRRARRAVYWWSPEIAALRTTANRARRLYVRCRRRNGYDPGLEEELRGLYKSAKKALQLAISRAKAAAREEILADLDRDPWGRPFRAARNKLRTRGAPLTETLPPDLVERVVSGLFPDPPGHTPPVMDPPLPEAVTEATPALVTEGEMEMALDRLRGRKTAPGPDGIPGRVLALALKHLGVQLRELFDACIVRGEFPQLWKMGRLCLLPKGGDRPLDSPSAYRPIVLLDEMGKMLERVIAARLVHHLESVGPPLSDAQYGFRAGRSTLDALTSLREDSKEAVDEGDVVVGTSIDVANAFNSIPFETIMEALRYHGVPLYLRRLIAAYLLDRGVVWEGSDGRLYVRRMGCGVPQGSVLGPILWNIGYDWLLRGPVPPGTKLTAFADDTFATARGASFGEAARLAAIVVSMVMDRIAQLGLRVSLPKTEAILFHGPRRGPPRGAHINVQGVEVPVRAQMRYLGLTLDGRWNFGAHFTQMAPKLISAAAALGRLLPNVGGPGSACRRLYSGIVRSMALYGAPVWTEALTAKNRVLLRRPQRVIAVRSIRGYRTVSWTAATLLAGDPPWELQAGVLAEVFRYRGEARARGERPAPEEVRRVRTAAYAAMIRRWGEDLGSPVAGRETVEAIRPHLSRWMSRRWGTLTFRLVQVLSGHGCFGKYLHQIAGREPNPACHECDAPVDTARHTLEECAAWGPQRHTLSAHVGGDLSLSSVIDSMLDSERSWEAMVSFCESVMSQKEAAERAREATSSDPLRRGRRGARRRRYAHLLPPP